MEDLRSLVRSSITNKIIDPGLDITRHKKTVRDYLSLDGMSKSKFKLEVVVPIHLPPKSQKGTCRKVVDLVENEFPTGGTLNRQCHISLSVHIYIYIIHVCVCVFVHRRILSYSQNSYFRCPPSKYEPLVCSWQGWFHII